MIGTVRSMSPEQAEGRKVDARSDLFSLGVLLYEMVTGQSPFRGSNALITLRRLLTETPRPVGELRPDVPDELAILIDKLLQKDPQQRSRDALGVARILADIAARSASGSAVSSPAAHRDGFGSELTGSLTGYDPDAPRPTAAEPSALAPVGRRRHWLAAAIGLILILILIGALLRGDPHRNEPLRVVVLPPEIETAGATAELEWVASGLRVAALAILADLEGIDPVDPSEMAGTSGSAIDIARAVAADDALVASVEQRDGSGWIFLRRIRVADSAIRWAKEFEVPLNLGRARLVAEAMTVQLQRAYPKNSLRPGIPRLQARDADFAEFVQINQRIDSGETPLPPELERLAQITLRSPRFLAGLLRAAKVALTLHSDTRQPDYLDQAADWIRRARELAPGEPAAVQLEIQLGLARGELDVARAALEELTQIEPNGIEALFGQFRIARADGDLTTAEAAMEQVVERQPSWGNLYSLAAIELRRGDVEGAREHLDALLQRAPENTWGLGKLTQLELLYGDLERAEQLAQNAITIRPHRSYYNNLGLAQFFLGRYQDARTSYLQALAVDPGHLTVRLNLADTELALGNPAAATNGYRKILDDLDGRELTATESMTQAQCLAHLGETRQAVAVTLETLQQHPGDAEVAYQAALVYSLVGEADSAWVNLEHALELGVQPRQFTIPAFGILRSDPHFQELIGGL